MALALRYVDFDKTGGSDDGLSESTAWETWASFTAGVAAGQHVYLKQTTSRYNTGSSPQSWTISGDDTSGIILLEGYKTTPGDGGDSGVANYFQYGSTTTDRRFAIASVNGVHFVYWDWATSTNFQSVLEDTGTCQNILFYRCKFEQHNTGTSAYGVSINVGTETIIECISRRASSANQSGCLTLGVDQAAVGNLLDASNSSGTGNVMRLDGSSSNCTFVAGNVLKGPGKAVSGARGIYFNGTQGDDCRVVMANTIHDVEEGIGFGDMRNSGLGRNLVMGNLIYDVTNGMISDDATTDANYGLCILANAIGGETTDYNNLGDLAEILTSVSVPGDPFTDSANDDYSLAADVILDTHPDTERDTFRSLGNGSIFAWGQSFVGDGGTITKAGFQFIKTGSPTGNMTYKIYASTGSVPTATPTGAALATSNNIDASTAPISPYGWMEADFPTPFETVDGTTYFVVAEFNDDSSNYLQIGSDGTTPTHSGNGTFDNGSWGAHSHDIVFRVYRDNPALGALVPVDITYGGSDTEIMFDRIPSWMRDADQWFNATWIGYGQHFIGEAGDLSKMRWWGKKTNSPTGNAYAKIYASTGTVPTATPTGSALATSDAFDVSTMTTSYAWIEMTFSTPYTMTPGTEYFITIECSDADNTNTIQVGKVGSGGHPGNAASSNGTWTSNTAAVIFEAYMENPALGIADYNGADIGAIQDGS